MIIKRMINSVLVLLILSFAIPFLYRGCVDLQKDSYLHSIPSVLFVVAIAIVVPAVILAVPIFYFSGYFDDFLETKIEPYAKSFCDWIHRRSGEC